MLNKNTNARTLAEAGLLLAFLVVAIMISLYVPIFSSISLFIIPIPITIAYIRHNLKTTLTLVVASIILVSFFSQPIMAVSNIIMYGFIGISLGYCVRNNKKPSFALIMLTISIMIAILINLGIYTLFIDTRGLFGIINDGVKMFIQSIDIAKKVYIAAGIPKESLAVIDTMKNTITTDFLLKVIPAFFIIISTVIAYLNYIITRIVLKKMKYEMEPITPISKIHVNNRIGGIIIIIYLIGVILNAKRILIGSYILGSSFAILQVVFTFNGISLVSYYLIEKFNMRKITIALIILITINTPLANIYFIVGAVDMIFDFRKLDYQEIIKS